ncbi:MAG TPA: MFS transporter, partial [Ktedonobacterales bacterium]|nr:MFS transporter [Ktedonobacterales bacterium]
MSRLRLPSSLDALSEPRFRLLWAGQATSAIGDGILPIAAAFAVLRIGGSATDLGLVLAARTVSQLASFLVGGVWADRLPRQLVMLTSDLFRAAQQFVIGALLITGHARVWHLVVGAIVYGFAFAFFQPASTGLVPATVPPSRLQQANALMGLSRSINLVVGPLLSGLLVALIGPGWVFIINGATFIVSAVSLALLRVQRAAQAARQSFFADLAAGWHQFAIRPWYWQNLCAHALWSFGMAAFYVLGPIVAARQLGGASAWGLIYAGLGVGLVVGGIISLRLMPARPLVAANLALVPGALPLLALAVPLPVIVIGLACVIAFAGLAFLNEVWDATMQQLIPPA